MRSFDFKTTDTPTSNQSALDENLSVNREQAESILLELASSFPFGKTTGTKQPVRPDPAINAGAALEVDARYRTLVEQIPAVVFMAFLDKGIGEAYVSPQIEEILGFTQEEWLNDPGLEDHCGRGGRSGYRWSCHFVERHPALHQDD